MCIDFSLCNPISLASFACGSVKESIPGSACYCTEVGRFCTSLCLLYVFAAASFFFFFSQSF